MGGGVRHSDHLLSVGTTVGGPVQRAVERGVAGRQQRSRGGDGRHRQVGPSDLNSWRAGPVGAGGRWATWVGRLGPARRHSGIYDLFKII
jgi:hypothetical protein